MVTGYPSETLRLEETPLTPNVSTSQGGSQPVSGSTASVAEQSGHGSESKLEVFTGRLVQLYRGQSSSSATPIATGSVQEAAQPPEVVQNDGVRDMNMAGGDVDAARPAFEPITPVCRPGEVAVNVVARGDTTVTVLQSLIDTFFQPLNLFNIVVTTIADTHPYAKVALGVLTAASQLIVAQADLDDAVSQLLHKVSTVYAFLSEEDMIKKIGSTRGPFVKIAQEISACVQFIADYAETKNFWHRLGKNVMCETQTTISNYTNTLDELMQQYRDFQIRDVQIDIYRVLEDLKMEGMAYASGAGLNTMKGCLENTRTKILGDIMSWATGASPGMPPILWLHGQAGSGKSAIAHTIASFLKVVGGLGSCFCFARDRQDEHLEEKMFTTIARDLAGHYPAFRRALAHALAEDHTLKTTTDLLQQWRKLILEPLSKAEGAIVGYVVVVIDALDECGQDSSRRHILSILASTEAAEMRDLRVLLTSRSLPDIEGALDGTKHVKVMCLDNVPAESAQEIDGLEPLLDVIQQSHDPEVKRLRENYNSLSEMIVVIDPIIRGVLESCPLVVVDVTTGCLCDRPERMRIFKASRTFKELVSSTARELDNERVLRVVALFFRYTMFSHVWQGDEPLFQDVNAVESVWNLPDTPLNKKLCKFCDETRRLGHNWAWSDTCCIDRATSSLLNQSLTSMYKWYADSVATLVLLADVEHPSKPGDLARSRWMTRAWTLQELLAPKVVFFYDSKWKPYLGITDANHKESQEIIQELANTIAISSGTIVTFSPDYLGVREKLRLASMRNATVKEDVAYSLIGIFRSDIRPHYGEGADALGHLLEEIVARSGEVTVLAWTGKSSSYNSCLPASVSVYSQTPYNPPSPEGQEMETYITELPQREALSIYRKINSLPPARFAVRRLHLPCIVFPVRRLGIQELRRGDENLYRARVSGLGHVEFTTADDLSLHEPQKFVFAHPWIRHIRGPSSGIAWGDDSESGSESGGDTSLHAVPTPQISSYARALQMIFRLGQPFSTLLLVQQPNEQFRRVAADKEIVVSGLGTNITSKNIRARVLEIL